jgi:stage III sporulation protein AD
MTIFKICAIAILTAVVSIVVKQTKPEYALFVQLGGVTIVLLFAVSYFTEIAETAMSMIEFTGINTNFLRLLVKALGISITAEIAADICRDSDSKSLAGNIELAAKLIILTMSLPLIKEVAELAVGMING